MTEYYYHDGSKEVGPFNKDELKRFGIKRETPIWYEEIENWTTAEKVDDLKDILPAKTPPTFGYDNLNLKKEENRDERQSYSNRKEMKYPSQKKSKMARNIFFVFVIIIFVGIVAIVGIIKTKPSTFESIEIKVNAPKPILTYRQIENVSTLLKAKVKVTAYVRNDGGAGNVLITYIIYQDGMSYDMSKSIYMESGKEDIVSVEFDEVKRLKGDVSYNINVRAE